MEGGWGMKETHDEFYEVAPRGYYALACYKIKRVAVIASLALVLGVLNLAGIFVILALL